MKHLLLLSLLKQTDLIDNCINVYTVYLSTLKEIP